MKQHGDPSPGAGPQAFQCPLPGDEEVWRESSVGQSSGWSTALRSWTCTVAALPHPSGLFLGKDLTLLHNRAWQDAGGKSQQGQRQRSHLSDGTVRVLSSSDDGATKTESILGRDLLFEDSRTRYTAIVSRMTQSCTESEDAVLVQLISSNAKDKVPVEAESVIDPPELNPANPGDADLSKLGQVTEKTPLDQHPFFHTFAAMIPTGLAILDHEAQAVFVNQLFYDLTTHKGEDQSFQSWPQSIHRDDYDRVMDAYREAFQYQRPLRTEFRASGQKNPWRLLLLTPLGDENLQHVSLREYGGFVCSVVDVTNQKQNELDERQKAKDATERKEQQERFIDMISHEIRNPLSAILHSNEDIQEAVKDADDDHGKVNLELLHEAVSTIGACLEHQRNIVDDVLSFSKLDAAMLSLRPAICNPSKQLADNLKMFQPEFKRQMIDFDFVNDTTYSENNVDLVLADMARIGQVLVNLTSNAIKFTARKKGAKGISVSVGASKNRPDSYPPNVVLFNFDESIRRMDATNADEWGQGESVYIMVAVKDTGIGISEEGQERLFQRFSQVTPKTAEFYGGSGLGLNISRKICHLHGGEIGVSSKEGEGSTFGFFFKVKRNSNAEGGEDTSNHDEITRGLKERIRKLDLAEPNDLTDDMVPSSLHRPPVKDVKEVNAETSPSNDQRIKTTRKVTNHLEEEKDRQESKDESSSRDQQDTAHILLVEDNVINQKVLRRKLESKGFKVTIANNGKEAVDLAQRQDLGLQLVLMDQEMPIMDGQAAAREIRRLEEAGEVQRLPICGVTANVRTEQQDEMIESGMDDVISKPYKIEEMVEKIRTLLGS